MLTKPVLAAGALIGLGIVGVIYSLLNQSTMKTDLAAAKQEAKQEGRAMCVQSSDIPGASVYVRRDDDKGWKLKGTEDVIPTPPPPVEPKRLYDLAPGNSAYTVGNVDRIAGKLYLWIGKEQHDNPDARPWLVRVERTANNCWVIYYRNGHQLDIYEESSPGRWHRPVMVVEAQ